MTRLNSSIPTLAAAASVSAGLTAFFALLLTGAGHAETRPTAKPIAAQTTQVSASTVPAPTSALATQLTQGRDGQRTVRVVYAGPIVAR